MSASAKQLHHVYVSESQAGERLDRWLTHLSFIPSRSRAAELIERGLVTLNGKPLKPAFKVAAGLCIQVEMPEAQPSELIPLNAPLDILFQDEDVVVINKPAGLVVHPAAGHAQDTLVNILLHHVGHLSMGFAEHRPGIVHRLDRDTSGVLVVAKNDFAHQHLSAQFRNKSAHRIYWAIVHGKPKQTTGTVRSYLARHASDRKRFASNPLNQGKLAVTHYKLRESLPNGLSWVECKLETGRTHQIRVHLSESQLSIVGDPIYGLRKRTAYDSQAGRLALHACELGFVHPRSGEGLFFRISWPADLSPFVRDAGFSSV